MSAPTDFAIVSLSEHPEIARRCGTDRVLIEAIEMHGAAEVVGVAREWTVNGGPYVVPQGAWLNVPEEYRQDFERLFVEARKQTSGPDYHDARNGWRDAKPASAPLRPGAPITMRKARMMR